MKSVAAMRRFIWIGLAVLCSALLALGSELCRSHAQRYFAQTQRYDDVYYLPPNDYLVLASLGYRAAVADAIWMKALIYYGEELGHRGDVAHLYRYGDAMVALDPAFKRVYRWVASCALYRTGRITVDDARAAIRYLEQAARLFPDDGEIAWDLGANYAFELVPMLKTRAEREEARQRGLAYLEAAALRHAGPSWLALQNAGQLAQLGRSEQAIRHLEDVYATASDPTLKQRIEQQLSSLRTQSYVEALRHTAEQLEAARMRDFPYVDASLYLLVGPRPAFGGDAWLAAGFDPLLAPEAVADDSR